MERWMKHNVFLWRVWIQSSRFSNERHFRAQRLLWLEIPVLESFLWVKAPATVTAIVCELRVAQWHGLASVPLKWDRHWERKFWWRNIKRFKSLKIVSGITKDTLHLQIKRGPLSTSLLCCFMSLKIHTSLHTMQWAQHSLCFFKVCVCQQCSQANQCFSFDHENCEVLGNNVSWTQQHCFQCDFKLDDFSNCIYYYK